jgi:flagellin
MAIVLNTNNLSLRMQSNYRETQMGMRSSLSRLSSGRSIVSAADDPSGLSVATNLNAQARSARAAIRSANDGMSIISTAEGSANEFIEVLNRMRELAMQSASDTYSPEARVPMQAEYAELSDTHLKDIVNNTHFNGVNVVGLTSTQLDVQVGTMSTADDRITINLADLSSAQSDVQGGDISTRAGALTELDTLDAALLLVSQGRSQLGAAFNRLESSVAQNTTYAAGLEAAASKIQDADFAAESAQLARRQMLGQTTIAMLAQAKGMHSGITALFG